MCVVWCGVVGVCVGRVKVCGKGGCRSKVGWGRVVVVEEFGGWEA